MRLTCCANNCSSARGGGVWRRRLILMRIYCSILEASYSSSSYGSQLCRLLAIMRGWVRLSRMSMLILCRTRLRTWFTLTTKLERKKLKFLRSHRKKNTSVSLCSLSRCSSRRSIESSFLTCRQVSSTNSANESVCHSTGGMAGSRNSCIWWIRSSQRWLSGLPPSKSKREQSKALCRK